MTTLQQKMNAYLRERGIEPEYVVSAGLRAVSRTMAIGMKFPLARYSNGGIVIPYLHPLTRVPHDSLMRIRFFDPPPKIDKRGYGTSFSSAAVGDVRYIQPKDSGIEAFFDANVPWNAVFADQTIGIRIVEGEIKALALNQQWRALDRTVAVALGGVWNFRTTGGKDLTPWLRMVRAASQNGRRLIITFDDDAATNESIQKAEMALTKLLAVRV